MFAIAWKEYRQIRFVALALVGVVMAAYLVLSATPWADGRGALVGVGVVFATTLIGALAFSEEKRAGTDVYLRTLPVGPVRRWAVELATNLVLAAATICLLLLAVDLATLPMSGGLPGSRLARFLGDPQTFFLLVTVWSLAVFGSTVFENALLALLFAFVTGAVVLNTSVSASVRLRVAGGVPFAPASAFGQSVLLAYVGIIVTCLASSCVFEKVNVKRLGMLRRVAAAGIVLLLAVATATAAFLAPFALDIVRSWR